MSGADGCIWAQGKSSVGMSEAEYSELTQDWPLAAAKAFNTTTRVVTKQTNQTGATSLVVWTN